LISWFITIFIMFDGIAKPMPMLPPGARQDRGVDADELAAQIHERAAGIAGIDRRVGLDEVLVAFRVDAGAAERADDAGGHRVAEPNGLPIATTKSPTSALSRSAIGQVDEVRGLHLDDGDVRARVCADDLCLERAVVEQLHGDFGGVLDDVCVGDDVAVLRIDDHAGARALELTLRAVCSARRRSVGRNGSFSSGFCSLTVPRVAMFTTAGLTRLSIGASDGTGVSPDWFGS
jgi:hypothetical protein